MTGGQEVYFTPWLYHPFFSLTSVALGPAGKRSPEPAVRELSLTEWASLKCWQEEGPWRDEAPDCSPAVSTQCLLKCEQQRSSHHPPRCWVELLLFRTPFPAPPSPPPPSSAVGILVDIHAPWWVQRDPRTAYSSLTRTVCPFPGAARPAGGYTWPLLGSFWTEGIFGPQTHSEALG